MPKVYRHAIMPYSSHQMYEIVNAVDEYPSFLPWCEQATILRQTDEIMEATILMKKGKLNHSFTTLNTFSADNRIQMQLVNGPFKTLSGVWMFTALSDSASKIELNLEFEFSNRMISLLIGPVFTQIANSLVDAFCQRAHQIYRN